MTENVALPRHSADFHRNHLATSVRGTTNELSPRDPQTTFALNHMPDCNRKQALAARDGVFHGVIRLYHMLTYLKDRLKIVRPVGLNLSNKKTGVKYGVSTQVYTDPTKKN